MDYVVLIACVVALVASFRLMTRSYCPHYFGPYSMYCSGCGKSARRILMERNRVVSPLGMWTLTYQSKWLYIEESPRNINWLPISEQPITNGSEARLDVPRAEAEARAYWAMGLDIIGNRRWLKLRRGG